MANTMNYQYGTCEPVISKAVPTATVVEIGDLISDAPESAADTAWDTDLATTQEAFHDVFLGASGQQSRAGDIVAVRANTRGVHKFDCASAAFDLGDLVGPAKASGNALENQKVVAVGAENLAVGRVVKQYDSATTTVLVELISTVIHGGPQAAA